MSRAVPPVSIGLPVYNGERYLQEAIDSLLAQDFTDFELVIADNASTDATEQICREAVRRDARVSYHRADQNRGAAWNFSRLLGLTSGHYFRWASHDDACEATYLRRCVEVLQTQLDVSLAFSRSVFVDADTTPIRLGPLSPVATEPRPAARARSVMRQRLLPNAAPFGLVRREQALRTDLIAPYKGSDRTFLLQLALQGKFHEIPEPLHLHRRHGGRSVRLPREHRLAWWDGGAQGRSYSHRWGLLRGYAAALASAPVPMSERIGALAFLPLWMGRNASPLSRELVAGLRQRGVLRPPSLGAQASSR